MLYQQELQSIYEKNHGIQFEFITDTQGERIYFKNVAYNSLSISNVAPPAYDENKIEIQQTKLSCITIKKEYYPYFLLLSIGKFYLSKWFVYGDDFDLTRKDIMSFSFPFNKINKEDCETLRILYQQVLQKLPSTIQYKLNAKKYVGTFNTRKLWNITDKSDLIFLKYISDNPVEIQQKIENHISACVVTNKGLYGDELNDD